MGISSYRKSSPIPIIPENPSDKFIANNFSTSYYLQAEQSLRFPQEVALLAGEAMPSPPSADRPYIALGCKRVSTTSCWHLGRGHAMAWFTNEKNLILCTK